ncbi:MAG: O-methyltransferase [Bacteroidales bacterium]|jgi:predicted O-methyltransferase YrrM|nr:O-methyltransferase [Bacteroidales bacterium]
MDRRIEEYIFDHLGPESSVLNELYRYTNLNVPYPGMISGHEQGRLLSMISHMVSPGRILEIGAYTGYSAICLAEGLIAGGRLHTIEQDDERAEIASTFFEKAGVTDRITLHVGDALEMIPQFDIVFDLVFIDAAKKQYLDYYHAIFDKVKQGGYILVDNILWYGKVADPQIRDETTDKLRDFNDFVSKDERIKKAIIQNRDGLFILRKK